VIWLLPAAFGLDLLFGDPRRMPHPVVGIGRLISWLEDRLAPLHSRSSAGLWLVVATLVITGLLAWLGLTLLALVSTLLSWLASVWLAYTTLALRELHRQSRLVVDHVEAGDLDAARTALGQIVGRDTAQLNEEQILKACIETVAENASDGVIAPLFYLALGGPILALLYKAINTMDSMLGYKNEKYLEFGRVAAKLDDLVNWLPARLTALLMVAAAATLGLDPWNSGRCVIRDASKHVSPNAGWPEAAAAGALGIQLGGPANYFGKVVDKATLGDPDRSVTVAAYRGMVRLLYVSAGYALLMGVGVRWLLS
jgi:adenosylcobinamide-phosphate synthase